MFVEIFNFRHDELKRVREKNKMMKKKKRIEMEEKEWRWNRIRAVFKDKMLINFVSDGEIAV